MGFRILFLILFGLIPIILTLPVCHSSKTFLLDYVFFGSFIQMPEDSMKHILERLDFPSILVLRETCHDLRNFIDDTEPASHLENICLNVYPEFIKLRLKSPAFDWTENKHNEIRIYYEKFNEGCLVKKYYGSEEVKRTILENEDFQTVFSRDFDIIMRHQKTVLNKLSIHLYFSDSPVNERILESINKSFKSMNHPLQVKELNMEKSNHNEILTVLPYIDPKTLEWIVISERYGGDNAVLKLDEIEQLEQWKQAKKLSIQGFQLPDLAQNIKHFSSINLSFREIFIETLILLKEVFLRSSTLNRIEIVRSFNKNAVIKQRLIETFGQPFSDREWFFRIPDTTQFLRITQKNRYINFDRIEQSDLRCFPLQLRSILAAISRRHTRRCLLRIL